MKKTVMFIVCAASVNLAAQAAFPADGKLSINKNNIKVWTYQNPDNPVFLYKAETTFDVPAEKAVALVLDAENAPKWVPYMSAVKVLSRDDKKGEFTLYMVLDFPFPLKDRDVVVKGKIIRDAQGSITLQNKAVEKSTVPINSNYVRLTRYEGDWVFQKLSAEKVKVTTYGFADPAGSIPLSVANMFVQQQPYQMLQKMKIELNKNRSYKPLPDVLK